MNDAWQERYWKKVRKTDGCWFWTGHVGKHGYGHFSFGRITHGAHRVAWLIANGPIPDGLCVCHTCDVRHCVRPDHLWLGTYQDNIRDMHRKGRHFTYRGGAGGKPHYGEKNGNAKLTKEQVAEIRKSYVPGRIGYTRLGHKYGVSNQTIRGIILGQYWKGIE